MKAHGYLLLFLFCWQGSTTSPTDILIKKAEHASDQKKAELGAMLFRAAFDLAARDPNQEAKGEVLLKLEKALESSDPLYKIQVGTRADVVRNLLRAAQRYLKKGWTNTARPLIEEAMNVDAHRVSIAGLASLDPKETHGGNSEIARHFPDLKTNWNLKGWKKEKDTYIGPWDTGLHASAILTPVAHDPGFRLEVEIQIEDRMDAGGFVIGYKGPLTFLALEVAFAGDTGQRIINLSKPNKTGMMTSLDMVIQDDKRKTKQDWIKLIVEVRPGEVAYGIDGFPLKVSSQPIARLTGPIGLHISSGPTDHTNTRFRNFKLTRLVK